jgi:hypothetical protein
MWLQVGQKIFYYKVDVPRNGLYMTLFTATKS